MIGSKYIARMDQLLQRNRLLGFALAVMLVFNLFNWFSLQMAKTSSRVTLIPIAGGSGMWVGNGKASDEYLRAMARYIVGQVGQYAAGTYRAQLQELLLLFPADSVGQAQSEFMKLADEVDRYPSISSVVVWTGQQPLKTVGDMMQVHVIKTRLVNGNSVDKPVDSYYCITYRIADTQFELVNIEELSGQGEDLCLIKSKNEQAAPGAAPATPSPQPQQTPDQKTGA